MYTKEWDEHTDSWAIIDPDGVYVCLVRGTFAADALLTHLNRGM